MKRGLIIFISMAHKYYELLHLLISTKISSFITANLYCGQFYFCWTLILSICPFTKIELLSGFANISDH